MSINNNLNGQSPDQHSIDQASQQSADKTVPEHSDANQPQNEAERQQQLQNAHLENQDARVKLPDQHQEHEPEHKEMGSMDH